MDSFGPGTGPSWELGWAEGWDVAEPDLIKGLIFHLLMLSLKEVIWVIRPILWVH